MKFLIFIIAFLPISFLVSCTSATYINKISVLNFSTISAFQIGITTKADILKTLGEPSSVAQQDGFTVLNYNEQNTSIQRVSINIDKNSNKLISLFWLPQKGEAEYSIDYAKKTFKNATYHVEEDQKTPSHMVSSGILFYIDKKSGITIRYDKRNNKVEAIALYESESRVPASSKE